MEGQRHTDGGEEGRVTNIFLRRKKSWQGCNHSEKKRQMETERVLGLSPVETERGGVSAACDGRTSVGRTGKGRSDGGKEKGTAVTWIYYLTPARIQISRNITREKVKKGEPYGKVR